jgi:hypothetical protein
MALHRDIYWVGRQWAVTGHGMQTVDQKLKGKFDIEAARLWEDGLLESLRTERWLNVEDFEKGLTVARKHFPEPPRKTAPSEERVLGLIETVLKDTSSKETSPKKTDLKKTNLKDTGLKDTGLKEDPVEEPKPVAQKFNMRIESWPAKFVPQWRVRIRR